MSSATVPNNPPTSIRAFLNRTTRTAVYVHPLRWSPEHLSILRISRHGDDLSGSASLPPTTAPPSSSFLGNQPHPLINKYALQRSLHPWPNLSPFSGIASLLTETINTLQKFSRPHYACMGAYLPLAVAGRVVRLEPLTYISLQNRIPFLAYIDPAHRHTKLEALKKKRWPDPYTNERGQVEPEDLDPYNIAILIAMAQVQASILGGTTFTVYSHPHCHTTLPC